MMSERAVRPAPGGAAATPPASCGVGGIRLRADAPAEQAGRSRTEPGPRGSGPSQPGPGGTGATPSRPSRKHPAHLPNAERHNQPVIIFLTVCTRDRRPVLATPALHALLVRAWQSARQWRVGNYLIMPDHVHLFCSPAMREAENVRDWAAYWKGLVARAVQGCGPLAMSIGAGGTAPSPSDAGTGGPGATPAAAAIATLWQRDCGDTQLRDVNHYAEKWLYLTMNPVRQGLGTTPESWPFAGSLNELRW